MKLRGKYQFGIVGLLLLTAVAAFAIRGVMSYYDRPDMFQRTTLMVNGKLTDQTIAQLGSSVAADPNVLKMFAKKRVTNLHEWLSTHVRVSKLDENPDSCVLKIHVRAKSWEFKQAELKIIIDSATEFVGDAPGVEKTAMLVSEIGNSN